MINFNLEREITRKLYADVNFLAEIPCFKGWSYKSMIELCNQNPLINYKRGHFVYNEEDEPENMYIIKTGQFKVIKESEAKNTKKGRKIIEVIIMMMFEIAKIGGIVRRERNLWRRVFFEF